jgi:hypothetical protein
MISRREFKAFSLAGICGKGKNIVPKNFLKNSKSFGTTGQWKPTLQRFKYSREQIIPMGADAWKKPKMANHYKTLLHRILCDEYG